MIAQHWRRCFVLLALHLTVSISHGMILGHGVSCSDSGVLTCGNGRCVSEIFRCDGDNDCGDETDEERCPCSVEQFKCSNVTRCIPGRFRCDGDNDCGDNSDEQDCDCPLGAFQCKNVRQCILASWRCDGDYDCLDGTDERDCQGCSDGQFRCNNTGRCISGSLRCNGDNDCVDNSDEANCTGCAGHFKCLTTGRCIPIRFICDGNNNCGDMSDERGCVCHDGQYTCVNNRRCISTQSVCNGINDCKDNSDEAYCPCQPGQFRCNTGRCISNQYTCDGYNDCKDLSDEQGCNVTSKTRILSVTSIPDVSMRQTSGSSPEPEAIPKPNQNPRSEFTTVPDAGDSSKTLSDLLTSPILYGVGGAVVITAIVAVTLCCIFARRRKRANEVPTTIRSNPPNDAPAANGTLQSRNQTNPEYNHYEYIPANAYSSSEPKPEHAYLQPQLSAGTYIHAPKNDDYLKPMTQRVAGYMQINDDGL